MDASAEIVTGDVTVALSAGRVMTIPLLGAVGGGVVVVSDPLESPELEDVLVDPVDVEFELPVGLETGAPVEVVAPEEVDPDPAVVVVLVVG